MSSWSASESLPNNALIRGNFPPTPEGFRGSLLIVVFYSWEVTKLLQICRKKSRAMTSILWISG